jgi:hypothetical protein
VSELGLAIAIEDVRPGDEILVHRRIGFRPVLRVDRCDTLGVEAVECYRLVYKPAGPGQAYENRSGAKGVISTFKRDEVGLKPLRAGETVTIRRGG